MLPAAPWMAHLVRISGKSVTALSILQLLPYPAASHTPVSIALRSSLSRSTASIIPLQR